MDSEASSIVEDSDGDEESMKMLTYNEANDDIISDSDTQTSSGRNSTIPSAASISSAATDDGSITPLIHKAIRRSIHKIAKESSEAESDDNDSNSREREHSAGIVISSEDSDDDVMNPILKNHKRMVIEDDSSDETCTIEELETSKKHNKKKHHEKSNKPLGRKQRQPSAEPEKKPVQKRPRDKDYVIESEDEEDYSSDEASSRSDNSRDSSAIELLEIPKKQVPIVNISDSEKDKENNPDDSLETTMALSLAKEEISGATFDPVKAQKRALLLYNQQQIETRLAKARILLKTGNVDSLPDKGERLRQSVKINEKKLAEVTKELQLFSLQQDLPKIKTEKTAPLFKQDSLEVDPTYLKPTTNDMDRELGRKAQETLQREQSLTVERLQDLHGSLMARPADDEKAEDPRGLRIPLMPHQQHALAWLLWRERQKPPGGVLADDMGLGKTLTMISLVMASIAKSEAGDQSDDEESWQSSARAQKHLGGTLVIAPASLLAQWEAEVKNRCRAGILSVELYHGNNRENVPRRLAKFDIVVTTYNILSREYKMSGILYKIRWRRVILDEAHVIRNHKSQTCEAVCGLFANKRWALTGTPIHNKEMDLYSLLKFLQCSPFDDLRVWKRWVDNKNAAGHERLATVMKTLMLRRTKAELQAKGALEIMPNKQIETIEVELDPEERLVYDKVMVYSRTLFAQFLAQRAEKHHMFELGAGKYDKPSWQVTARDTQFTKAQNKLLSLHADVKSHEILVLLLRLRQVCCHPPLIHTMLDQEDIENPGLEENGTDIDLLSKMGKINLNEDHGNGDDDIGVDERVSEHLLTSDNPVFNPDRQSSKIRAVFEKVKEILSKGDKLIIVSQWVGLLNIIADGLKNIEEASYRMFTGQVAVKDRQGIMDEFNSKRAKPNVLLLSLTAGGVGLNLVGANHLLLVDIHWNPQLESQAQDRIYRFGQHKNVFIYKYICTDTIEERIKGLQEKKLELATTVLSGGGKVVGSKLSLDDIKSLFSL